MIVEGEKKGKEDQFCWKKARKKAKKRQTTKTHVDEQVTHTRNNRANDDQCGNLGGSVKSGCGNVVIPKGFAISESETGVRL